MPSISIFQGPSCNLSGNQAYSNHGYVALHFDTNANSKRLKLFWASFTGSFIYEIIPAYMFPLLNGISVFCLASQKAAPNVRNIFTNIFGGGNSNEGLGLLSLSFDWQYITSSYVLFKPMSVFSLTCTSFQIYEFSFGPAGYVSSSYILFSSFQISSMLANSWVGYAFCYIAVLGIYYSNTWNVGCLQLYATGQNH